MLTRLRLRGPDPAGAYEVFLDDELIGAGCSAQQTAVYVRDAWAYGATVVPELLEGRDGVTFTMPPEIARALAALGAIGHSELESEEATRP